VKDDEPAGLIKSLIAGGLEPKAGGGWQAIPNHTNCVGQGMLAHNHVEAPPADQKRPPSIATAVEDEAVALKGKQAPKDIVKGANDTGEVGTKVRILRAKLFGEMMRADSAHDIDDSELAKELVMLIGKVDAEVILKEVLEAQVAFWRKQNARLKQTLLKPDRKLEAQVAGPGKRAKPNRRHYHG
jgi:hypothetical protein